MRIRTLYFGMLKDLLGREGEDLELGEGARVGDVVRLLRGRASNQCDGPAHQDRLWASLACAVNEEYAALSATLHDGDEVALLPPVSGGRRDREAKSYEEARERSTDKDSDSF